MASLVPVDAGVPVADAVKVAVLVPGAADVVKDMVTVQKPPAIIVVQSVVWVVKFVASAPE